MVDMAPVSSSPQPTPMDLAPGPIMQAADASPPEAATQQVADEQIAPTPPQDKPEVAAPPEQKQATPPKPEPAKIVPEQKPAPVKPKVDPRRGQEADGRAARAPYNGGAARRAPGAGGIRRQRRRVRRGGRFLQADGRRAPATLQAIPAGFQGQRAARHRAREFYARAAAGRCCPQASADRRDIPRLMPRRWRWSAAPSRFRPFRPT